MTALSVTITISAIFITGVCRVIANMLLVVFSFRLFEYITAADHNRYLGTIITSTVLTFFFSVAVPTAVARYLGEPLIAVFVRSLHTLRWILFPLVKLLNLVDGLILRMVGNKSEPAPSAESGKFVHLVSARRRGFLSLHAPAHASVSNLSPTNVLFDTSSPTDIHP